MFTKRGMIMEATTALYFSNLNIKGCRRTCLPSYIRLGGKVWSSWILGGCRYGLDPFGSGYANLLDSLKSWNVFINRATTVVCILATRVNLKFVLTRWMRRSRNPLRISAVTWNSSSADCPSHTSVGTEIRCFRRHETRGWDKGMEHDRKIPTDRKNTRIFSLKYNECEKWKEKWSQ